VRYPLQLSRSGDFIEGLVDLPSVDAGTDLMLPTGCRPAVYTSKGVVGTEADLDVGLGQAWVAVELAKASRYKEWIRKLIAQGLLALGPGALPLLATKSAAGLYTSLPVVEWGIGPLHVPGGGYAVSSADIVRRFEQVGAHLPPETWQWLDAQAAQEAERNAAA